MSNKNVEAIYALSPMQQAKGAPGVESGNTWNTFIPRDPKPKDVKPPQQ